MFTVDFDHQFPGNAGEVSEERPDRVLTPELQSAHAVCTQEFPHLPPGAAVGQAKVPSPLGPFCVSHPPLLASPPAARAERDMNSNGHLFLISPAARAERDMNSNDHLFLISLSARVSGGRGI